MTALRPLNRDQTPTSFVPSALAAICALAASLPVADRSAALPQLDPPSALRADWVMAFCPLNLTHTDVSMLPSTDDAICGVAASWPATDRSNGALQLAPPWVLPATWTTPSAPSNRDHTAATLEPSAEDAICGLAALAAGTDKLDELPQLAPPSALVTTWTTLLEP